jgi:hypothetical protein
MAAVASNSMQQFDTYDFSKCNTKEELQAKLKKEYEEEFNEQKFDEDWKSIMDCNIDAELLLQKMQPLTKKQCTNQQLSYDEQCNLALYMNKYLSMGLNLEDLVNDDMTPGICILL